MSQLHSKHIFLFPFRWEVKKKEHSEDLPIGKKTILTDLYKKVDPKYWDAFKYSPKIDDGFNTYNEFSYFYDHARDVLNISPRQEYVKVKQFKYKISASSTYCIDINNTGKEYTLQITDVLLNVYESGIGVLSLHLNNTSYSDFDTILLINDYGRRLYPQFLGDTSPFTSGPKHSFLANKLTIRDTLTWMGNEVLEDFNHYNSLVNLTTSPFRIPNHIACFLGTNFKSAFESSLVGDIIISPVLDDRMFTMSFYTNKELVLDLAKSPNEEKYSYQTSRAWYSYIFVDPDAEGTCPSKTLSQSLITASTYDRWLPYVYDESRNPHLPPGNDGHIFGITRYSFCIMGVPGYFIENIVAKHFSYQYFNMVLLSLVQRTSAINFSAEVARISDRLQNTDGSWEKEHRTISDLYLQYIKFVNRLYFREITPQEQGIELYNLLQDRMRIKEEVEDLGREIQELNNFAEKIEESKLTMVASRFLPASFVASILGIGFISDKMDLNWRYVSIALLATTFFFSNKFIRLIKRYLT